MAIYIYIYYLYNYMECNATAMDWTGHASKLAASCRSDLAINAVQHLAWQWEARITVAQGAQELGASWGQWVSAPTRRHWGDIGRWEDASTIPHVEGSDLAPRRKGKWTRSKSKVVPSGVWPRRKAPDARPPTQGPQTGSAKVPQIQLAARCRNIVAMTSL